MKLFFLCVAWCDIVILIGYLRFALHSTSSGHTSLHRGVPRAQETRIMFLQVILIFRPVRPREQGRRYARHVVCMDHCTRCEFRSVYMSIMATEGAVSSAGFPRTCQHCSGYLGEYKHVTRRSFNIVKRPLCEYHTSPTLTRQPRCSREIMSYLYKGGLFLSPDGKE